MQIARIALASVLLLGACKEKKEEPKTEAKPAETTPKPTETAPTPTPTPPSPTPAPPPPTETKPAETKPAGGFNTQADYEAKANELMTQLISVFEKAGTNCDKLADGVSKFADQHKKELTGAKEFEKANPDAEKQLTEKMKPRQQELAAKLGPIMQKCQAHQGLKTAMLKLEPN